MRRRANSQAVIRMRPHSQSGQEFHDFSSALDRCRDSRGERRMGRALSPQKAFRRARGHYEAYLLRRTNRFSPRRAHSYADIRMRPHSQARQLLRRRSYAGQFLQILASAFIFILDLAIPQGLRLPHVKCSRASSSRPPTSCAAKWKFQGIEVKVKPILRRSASGSGPRRRRPRWSTLLGITLM